MRDKNLARVAAIFHQMQLLRIELLKSKNRSDLLLAAMLERGKDAMQDTFARVVSQAGKKVSD